ncbi:unnamed protein product [Lathyrus sativus]|nr:unnamed protein product [Lathyrus sativus]
MSHIQKYVINAHHNGNVIVSDEVDLIFENIEISHFSINRRSSFQHFKESLEMKVQAGPGSQIIYRSVVHFGNNQFKFVPLKVHGDKDVETMFSNHECFRFPYIDLYIRFEQCQPTQMSQIINTSEEDAPTIILNEDVEEENEAQVDDYYTTLFEEGDNVNKGNNDEQHIPVENVFCPHDKPALMWRRIIL